MSTRTCPTCRAPLPADIGWGLVGCPFCNTAIDMGPAPDEDLGAFHAGPSAFISSQSDKPFGAPAGLQQPPPAGLQQPPPAGQFAQPLVRMQPLTPPMVPQSPPAARSNSTITIAVLVIVGLGVVLGALPLLLFFL